MARSEEQIAAQRAGRTHLSTRDSWWRRRNRLYVRNGEMLLILAVALLAGVAATLLTAYLGVR